LSGKRYGIVVQKVRNLYSKSDPESSIIATVEPGVIAKVLECSQTWCKIDIQGIRGWLKREHLWGVYPDETKF
jgi:SH3-like domain-containing protein